MDTKQLTRGAAAAAALLAAGSLGACAASQPIACPAVAYLPVLSVKVTGDHAKVASVRACSAQATECSVDMPFTSYTDDSGASVDYTAA